MKLSGGLIYTESGEREMRDFLKSQGLTDEQVVAVQAFSRSKISNAVNLWSPVTAIAGAACGIWLATTFGSNCVLF